MFKWYENKSKYDKWKFKKSAKAVLWTFLLLLFLAGCFYGFMVVSIGMIKRAEYNQFYIISIIIFFMMFIMPLVLSKTYKQTQQEDDLIGMGKVGLSNYITKCIELKDDMWPTPNKNISKVQQLLIEGGKDE